MPRSSVQSFRHLAALALPGLFSIAGHAAEGPVDLTDRFELPPGFHIYRAAGSELSGGSYALTFDGEGRLLVGDGNAVRRLIDKDGDGVFDSYEVIATGLGWRGPQGLLVYGDKLYAVGGDGIQVFEGYAKELVHKGRIGNKFNTGGDHDAHTIFRGHDGYLYFMAGNGAGIEDRKHITEESSPVLLEREASVFRISPDGTRWECIAAGGRNPPNLGMNHLGDLFSFDSDMEWHVGLPWYRAVRLNHWAVGGDQGWQEVGAYPPYFIDCLPGILDVGRGSPNWGVFYEHLQFPERYRDAYIVCDYRWKRESNDQYATTGRLVAFFLKRDGAGWKASMETLARPKPGARDADDKPINFALVDVGVAPDGSLFVTDHNQGLWRIHYRETAGARPAARWAPPIVSPWPPLPTERKQIIDELLGLPQPASERSRRREEVLGNALGKGGEGLIRKVALDPKRPLAERLRAVRLLAPRYHRLPADFLKRMARDSSSEIRAQSAWLTGIRWQEAEVGWRALVGVPLLLRLLEDKDPLVRRRAAEALTRADSPAAIPPLIKTLDDSDRLVRYVAMSALAHRPAAQWFDEAVAMSAPQIRMRALVAGYIRRELPPEEKVRSVIGELLRGAGSATISPPGEEQKAERTRSISAAAPTPPLDPLPLPPKGHETPARSRGKRSIRPLRSFSERENRLDLLRVLALFQQQIETDTELKRQVAHHLLEDFPAADRDIRWEQARLLGEYRVAEGFSKLLARLESERDEVSQFHLAQAISRLPSGWTAEQEDRFLDWMLGTQKGWFAQFQDKGVEFPLFWSTVLAEFGRHHRERLLRDTAGVDWGSLLGGMLIDLLADSPGGVEKLVGLYRENSGVEARVKIIAALKRLHAGTVSAFLRDEYSRASDERLRAAILGSVAARPVEAANLPLILEGLRHREVDVVRPCALALLQYRPPLDESLANVLVSRMAERRALYYSIGRLLAELAGIRHPGYKP
jgi:glucose/arabinose dehydrogenase